MSQTSHEPAGNGPAGPGARPTTKRAHVRGVLAAMIEQDLTPGDAIPSERALVSDLGVSRVTIRQAIADLVEEGRLERIHGRGTFVTTPQVAARVHLTSFSREMRARGLTPETRVVDACRQPPAEDVARQLGLRPEHQVFRVERLRLADGTPMAHEIGYYPEALFPGLLDKPLDFLYDVFAEEYGLDVTSGRQTVWAEAADNDHATILDVPRKTPLLVQERLTLCGRRPVELATSWYHADRYRLQMHVTPRGATT